MLIVNRNLPLVPSAFRSDPEIWLFMNAMRDRVGGTTGNLIYDAASTAAYVATTEPQLFAIKADLENQIAAIIPSITTQVFEQIDASLQAQAQNQQAISDTVNLVLEQVSEQGQDFAALMNMPTVPLSGTLDEVLKNGSISLESLTTGNHTISAAADPKLIISDSGATQEWQLTHNATYTEPYLGIKDVTGDDVRFSICTDVNTGIVKIGRKASTAPEPFLKFNNDPLQVYGTAILTAGASSAALRFATDATAQKWRWVYDTVTGGLGVFDDTASTWRLQIKDTTGNTLLKTTTEFSTETLQVRGDIAIQDTSTVHLKFMNTTNAQQYRLLYDAGIARFGIRDDTASAYRLTVADTTGNVLVKTTTDNGVDALQINGTCSSSGGFSGIGTNLTALNASNISSGTLANARLPNSGVAAGSYTAASITVDAKGIVTSASSNTLPTVTAGTAISVTGGPAYTINNTGVTSVIAGTGISVSSATGDVTITNTSPSDYRLKQDIQPLNNATDRLMNLKPVRFAFKSTPEKLQDGFIAHEVQEIVPEAVLGEKDGPEIQTLGMQMLVPLLVKALQEANERIAALEAKLETQ